MKWRAGPIEALTIRTRVRVSPDDPDPRKWKSRCNCLRCRGSWFAVRDVVIGYRAKPLVDLRKVPRAHARY